MYKYLVTLSNNNLTKYQILIFFHPYLKTELNIITQENQNGGGKVRFIKIFSKKMNLKVYYLAKVPYHSFKFIIDIVFLAKFETFLKL